MPYLYNTQQQTSRMLSTIGVSSVEEILQNEIPEELLLSRPLDLPPAVTEPALQREMEGLAGAAATGQRLCFLGGGVYDHFIPAVVDEITSRGEFYTAYTPYQAEASQGTLQAFYEFQSLICRLTGMEVANASLYEGGTAVSEAVFMAMRITRRHGNVVVCGSMHPEYRQVVDAYFEHLQTEVRVINPVDGVIPPGKAAQLIDEQTCCVVVQQPNFFGCLEDAKAVFEVARTAGALSVLSFDAISPGLIPRPVDYGADIAVAEGQPLGIPMQFGGPLLGLMACRGEYMRKMPGRLIGRTKDQNGKDCYALNLQAREQHIRREKATSNICTNQGLLALRATVYLSLLGPQGLRDVAETSCRNAHYAAEQLCGIDGVELAFDQPFFREFTLQTPVPAETVLARVRQCGIDVGPSLAHVGATNLPNAEYCFLVALTEQRLKADIDALVEAIRNAVAAGSRDSAQSVPTLTATSQGGT